jgi:hypothetical protein
MSRSTTATIVGFRITPIKQIPVREEAGRTLLPDAAHPQAKRQL